VTIKEIDVICEALAEVEQVIEDIPDPNGISASTLRIVIDRLQVRLAKENARFKPGIFEMKSMPIANERLKQALIAATTRS